MNHQEADPQIVKSEQQWRNELGEERYRVMREAGTERPFSGTLLNLTQDGTYLCGACGNALFSSSAKFESHCGWPSFTHPQQQQNVRLVDDDNHGMHRVEVRCKRCGSHLGHVFDDGPEPRNTRYCINSLSLAFDPTDSAASE